MPVEVREKRRSSISPRVDLALVIAGLALLVLFVTRYQMAFRLDDVIYLDWAQHHDFLQCWDPHVNGILNGFRPVLTAVMWILTRIAGTDNYLLWQITLDGSFLIALAYAGKTARYLSGRDLALYFTVVLYWIAFLPILNVLFWFSDLTFTVELMFVTLAWYYGLRGLLEGEMKSYFVGILCGMLAVMSKEPAIVFVHCVFIGVTVLRWREVQSAWRSKTRAAQIFAILLYVVFLGLSLYIYLVSPARGTRFIRAGSTDVLSSMQERHAYYASVFLSILPRMLLLFPLVFIAVRSLTVAMLKVNSSQLRSVALTTIVSLVVVGLPLYNNFILLSALLIASLVVVAVSRVREGRRVVLIFIPFGVAAVVTLAALSLTIMISKTQLTELAVLLVVIAGWAWSEVFGEVADYLKPHLATPRTRATAIALSCLLLGLFLFSAFPKIARNETLLGQVRDVRANANDAIKWCAKNLPQNAKLVVADYGLYGIANSNELNRTDDATKIGSQYVFHNGYVFIYLGVLARMDIRPMYLEDSVRAEHQLDSTRTLPNSYLFIQSELDYSRFHGMNGKPGLLNSHDSLMAGFYAGGFHSEVWRLD